MAEVDRLEALTLEIRRFVAEREWEPYHDPKNLAMALASEAGELLSELRWIASQDADARCREPEARERIADEVADVAITLLMFVDRIDLDLSAAVRKKLHKNALKYPKDKRDAYPTPVGVDEGDAS